ITLGNVAPAPLISTLASATANSRPRTLHAPSHKLVFFMHDSFLQVAIYIVTDTRAGQQGFPHWPCPTHLSSGALVPAGCTSSPGKPGCCAYSAARPRPHTTDRGRGK